MMYQKSMKQIIIFLKRMKEVMEGKNTLTIQREQVKMMTTYQVTQEAIVKVIVNQMIRKIKKKTCQVTKVKVTFLTTTKMKTQQVTKVLNMTTVLTTTK